MLLSIGTDQICFSGIHKNSILINWLYGGITYFPYPQNTLLTRNIL